MTLAHDRKSLHSQTRVTAASATACLACYRYIKRSTRIDKLSLRQYRDSLGLGIMCLIYITVQCIQGIPILILSHPYIPL